jgi:hypothetical protein
MDTEGQSNYYAWAWDTWVGPSLITDYSGTPGSQWGAEYKALVDASSAPANTAAPTITGAAQDSQTLTANVGTWSPSGLATYQWESCTSAATSSCTALSGATDSTYVTQDSDVGSYVDVVVTENNADGSSQASATPVGPVTPIPQPTDGIAFRQVQTAESIYTPGGTVQLGSPVSAGDDLFITVSGADYQSAGTTVKSVTDNVNGAWTQVVNTGWQQAEWNAYTDQTVYELTNSKAAPNGLTITITTSGISSYVSVVALDVGGVASATVAADNSLQDADWSTTSLNGGAVSAASGDLILGLYSAYVTNTTPESLTFSTPANWYTNTNYWIGGVGWNGTPAAAVDWRQTGSAGSVTPTIDSPEDLIGFGQTLDLHP